MMTLNITLCIVTILNRTSKLFRLQKIILTCVLIGLLSACKKNDVQKNSSTKPYLGRIIQPSDSLVFTDKQGRHKATLDIAMAKDDASRNNGLMDVRQLPFNVGMLFVFEQAQPLTFWMANTPLPLDILFISADSTIITIHKNTKAFSETQYSSDGEDAQFVVETNAGFTSRFDITVGDCIVF